MADLELKLRITADGKVAVEQVDNVAAATEELGDASKGASKGTESLAGTLKRIDQTISGSLKSLLQFNESLEALERIGRILGGAADLVDRWNEINGTLQLITDTTEEYVKAQEDSLRIALQTFSDLEATTDLYATLDRSLTDLGYTQEQFATATQAINESFQVSRASAEEAAGATRQLAQALQSGVLRGDEFNSVMEQAPRLQQALADSLGVSRGALRGMAEEGELTAKRVTDALLGQADAINAEFKQLDVTIGRALTNLETQWLRFVGDLDETTGASEAAASAIQALSDNLDAIGDVAGEAVMLAIGYAIAEATKRARAFVVEVKNTAAAQRDAAKAAEQSAAAETKAAQAAVVAARARQQATAATLAEARAQLDSVKELAIYGERRAASERQVTAAKQQHQQATEALAAAERNLTAAAREGLAAQRALAAQGGLVAAGMAKAKTAVLGLGTALRGLPTAFVISELFEIGQNLVGIVEQYREIWRIRENIAESADRIERVISRNLADLADAADTAILSQEQLADAAAAGGAAYRKSLEDAQLYWSTVAIEAKRAGDIAREAAAEARAATYSNAITTLSNAIAELTDRQNRLSPVAQTLADRFAELKEKGDNAASAIGKMIDELAFGSAEEALVNADALAEFLQNIAEQSALTSRELLQGLGPALQKLAAEDLREFALAWQTALDSIDGAIATTTASVIEGVLSAALAKLKLSVEDIRTGTTAAGREMVAAFETVAIAAERDAAVIDQAFKAALAGMKDTDDLAALEEALARIGDTGRIAMEDLRDYTEQLNAAQRDLIASTSELAQAYKELGILSTADLEKAAETARRMFEIIRDSGTATARDLRQAWIAYAERVVETGNQAQIATLELEAVTYGAAEAFAALQGKAGDAGATITASMLDGVKSVEELRKEVEQLDDDLENLGDKSVDIDFEKAYLEGRTVIVERNAVVDNPALAEINRQFAEYRAKRDAEEAAARDAERAAEERALRDQERKRAEEVAQHQQLAAERLQEAAAMLERAGSGKVIVAIDGVAVAQQLGPHLDELESRRA